MSERSRRGSGRYRSSGNKKKPNRNSVKKDNSIYIGIGLVIFGLASSLWMFDMLHDPRTMFDLSNFADILNLWPIFFVLLGFFFVFKDYLNKSRSQKWNS